MTKDLSKVLYFLGTLDDSDIDWMARHGARTTVQAGTAVIRQGEPIHSLFFILDGQFGVSKVGGGELARLGAGEMLGEISFVDARLPSATVTALVDSSVGIVARDALERKMGEDLAFSARFYKAIAILLADRLRTHSAQLGYGRAEAVEDDAEEIPSHLMDMIFMAGTRFAQLKVRRWGS